jgi:hypothetical protein
VQGNLKLRHPLAAEREVGELLQLLLQSTPSGTPTTGKKPKSSGKSTNNKPKS